jgi:hypothetical protein
MAPTLAGGERGIQKSPQPTAPEDSKASNKQINRPKNPPTAMENQRERETRPALRGKRIPAKKSRKERGRGK